MHFWGKTADARPEPTQQAKLEYHWSSFFHIMTHYVKFAAFI